LQTTTTKNQDNVMMPLDPYMKK